MACCRAGHSKDAIRSSIVVGLLIVVAIVKTSSCYLVLSRAHSCAYPRASRHSETLLVGRGPGSPCPWGDQECRVSCMEAGIGAAPRVVPAARTAGTRTGLT